MPSIRASSFISCLELPAASASVRLARQITALDSDRYIALETVTCTHPRSSAQLEGRPSGAPVPLRNVNAQPPYAGLGPGGVVILQTSTLMSSSIWHRNVPGSSRVFRLVKRLRNRSRFAHFASESACPLGRLLSTDKRKRRLYFDFGWAVEFSPHRLSSSSSSLDLRLIHRSTSPRLLIRPLLCPPNKDRSRRYRRSSRIQLSNVNVHSSLLLILP